MAKIYLKEGVMLNGLDSAVWEAVGRVAPLFAQLTPEKALTVTAGLDGKHMPGSKHYLGCAVDLRTHSVPRAALGELLRDVKGLLNADFFVQIEGLNEPDEHMHLQYGLKGQTLV